MQSWLDWLFPPRDDERIIRALAPDALAGILSPQETPATRPATLALLPLGDSRVRAAIHEAKYHGNEAASTLLANALSSALETQGFPLAEACLVPVPLGPARLRERGYNQVEKVLERTGLPYRADCLLRTRETKTQVGLSRTERLENLHGAFRAARPLDPAFLYIVVDDVVTTGATLESALQALSEAGAKRLLPIALAHS